MKKRLFILLLLSTSIVYGQDRKQQLTVDYCRELFAKQTELYPQEKIFLHTDRSSYLAGDTLWFKAYLTDAVVHLPSELSRFAYVELVNPWGNIEKRLKVKMGKGNSYAQIEIPEEIPEGNYYLRSYTGTMYGMPHAYFFNKRIYIGSITSTNIKEHFYYNFDKGKITASFYFTDLVSNERLEIDEAFVSINGDTPKRLRTRNNGTGQMTFQIPEDAQSRILHVQFDHEGQKYSKYVNIPYPENVFDVQFFPEGGNLIEGVTCLVGIKSVNGTGISEQVRGVISDNEGNIIIEDVHTLYKGMGSFHLTPQKGKAYAATMTNANGDTQVFNLPLASTEAVSLSAEWRNNNLMVSVKGLSSSNEAQPQYILVHSRGITHYIKEWDNRKNGLLALSKENLPSGVIQILLLNSNYQPISERMVFCMNDDHAHVQLNSKKHDDQIELDISLLNSSKKALTGNFSVSVTNDNFTSIDGDIDLFTYMLLSSEIEGHIEDPTSYFLEQGKERLQALDNLLLTQGWRRYNIPQVINGHMEEMTGFVELGQEISGTVKNIRENRSISNAQVRILSLDNMYGDETVADENGNFQFTGLDFIDNTTFVLQAYNQNGKDRVSLSIDEEIYPEILSSDLYFSHPKSFITENQRRIDYKHSFLLQELEVTAYRPRIDNTPTYAKLADVSFDSKKIEEIHAYSMYDVLKGIAGVRLVGNKVMIRGHSSIYKYPYASIAIDGIIVDEEGLDFELDIINMADVDRVDVFKGGNTVIWGHRGSRGVVSITTKTGNFGISNAAIFNTKSIKAMGYTTPFEYYTAKYDIQEGFNYNLRSLDPTVFWSPDINSDKNGKASLSFYIPNKEASYSVLLQGISDDGQIINELYKIKDKD